MQPQTGTRGDRSPGSAASMPRRTSNGRHANGHGSAHGKSSSNGDAVARTSGSNGHGLRERAGGQDEDEDDELIDGDYDPSTSASTRFRPIYPGSQIDRQELVRLTLQCLNDAGYPQAAAALSKESGYSLESPTITAFRDGVLSGKWESVSRILQDGDIVQGDAIKTVRFLISEQKFLEHLEARETKRALSVLRNELAPLNHNPERLHQLSSFMMCSSPTELRAKAEWLGAGKQSRRQLLESLQEHIPSTTMIPQRRLEALLEQAKSYQRHQCKYHAADVPISLFADHACDRSVFPTATTHILGGHTNEVWRVEFSHDGLRLATAGQDGKVLVWKVDDGFTLLHTLNAANMTENITCLAWSPDDSMLLLGVEASIKIYDAVSGVCRLNTTKHEYEIGGVAWLPDSSGFFSGGLDMRLLCWDLDGTNPYAFYTAPYRITDVAVAPDASRLVCLGEASHIHKSASTLAGHAGSTSATRSGVNSVAEANAGADAGRSLFEVKDRRIIIFNVHERKQERFIPHPTGLTSACFASDSSRFVLVNQAPDEVVLYDVVTGTAVKRYQGQQQGLHMIRSCFGGASNHFVISGSEDSRVYVWHKDNPRPLECLSGHGPGSVNDVSWNPKSVGMFASASDDHTIRIWQAPGALPTAGSSS